MPYNFGCNIKRIVHRNEKLHFNSFAKSTRRDLLRLILSNKFVSSAASQGAESREAPPQRIVGGANNRNARRYRTYGDAVIGYERTRL